MSCVILKEINNIKSDEIRQLFFPQGEIELKNVSRENIELQIRLILAIILVFWHFSIIALFL